MIKCPKCQRHISSMVRTCPECGASIDPEWAEQEALREQKKLDEVPFEVEVGPEEDVAEDAIAEEEVVEETQQVDNEPVEEPQAPQTTQQETVAAQAPAAKAGSRLRPLFVVVAVLGVLIGGLCFYDYRMSQAREERAYELLQDCSNPEFYEDFLLRFKDSKHADEVRERLRQVSLQQQEWQKLVLGGSRESLQRFVIENPSSPYVKVAQSRIDSIDWAEAKAANTLEAVTRYMAVHPDGYFIDQAETMRQSLERAKAAAAAALRDSLAAADSARVVTE